MDKTELERNVEAIDEAMNGVKVGDPIKCILIIDDVQYIAKWTLTETDGDKERILEVIEGHRK